MIQRPLRSRGFSVIELLVVIVIIAVLAAILLPLGGRMQERALRVGCMSNLRTIGIALTTYTLEHKGRLPGPSWQTIEIDKGYAISGILAPYLEAKDTDSLWECPGNKYVIARNREARKTGAIRYSSYVTHTPFFGYTYTPPKESIGSYRLVDIKEQRAEGDQWLLRDLDTWNYPVPARIGGTYPPVHGGGRNHLLPDSTVEWVKAPPR